MHTVVLALTFIVLAGLVPPSWAQGSRVTPAGQVVVSAPPVARVQDVTWSREGQVTKVVIRTSGPVNHRTIASEASIVVDLWRAHDAGWRAEPIPDPYARRLRIRQYTPELARIQIDLRKAARYKTFVKADPYQIALLIIPPWMATVKLPPSIAYEKLRVPTGAGTTAVHVLRVDPRAPDLLIQPVLAGDVGTGRETTSILATQHDALAGINGGYFGDAGSPLGMVVIDGELVSAPLPRRSVFAISRSGGPLIQAFEFQGRIKTADDTMLWISAVNRPPHAGGVAVYSTRYGPLTPPLQLAVIVRSGVVEGFTSGRILIPADGYVLTVNQHDAALLTAHLYRGQRMTISLNVAPGVELISALGGGPRLVKDGDAFVPFGWEWFPFRLHARRAPRTAVGITANGKLLLVTVDGRSRRNTGMTLPELALLMAHLGARDAMNLDGGGSATMVVGGRTVNEPSDGQERPIGSALVILRAGP